MKATHTSICCSTTRPPASCSGAACTNGASKNTGTSSTTGTQGEFITFYAQRALSELLHDQADDLMAAKVWEDAVRAREAKEQKKEGDLQDLLNRFGSIGNDAGPAALLSRLPTRGRAASAPSNLPS